MDERLLKGHDSDNTSTNLSTHFLFSLVSQHRYRLQTRYRTQMQRDHKGNKWMVLGGGLLTILSFAESTSNTRSFQMVVDSKTRESTCNHLSGRESCKPKKDSSQNPTSCYLHVKWLEVPGSKLLAVVSLIFWDYSISAPACWHIPLRSHRMSVSTCHLSINLKWLVFLIRSAKDNFLTLKVSSSTCYLLSILLTVIIFIK